MALHSSAPPSTNINFPSVLHTNDSFDQENVALIVTIILSPILILTILGNALVLYIFYKNPSLRKLCYYSIISLAMADILCAVFSMSAYIAKKHVSGGWPETVACNVFRFTYFFTAYASVLSLTIISIERLIVIKMAFRHDTWLTTKRVTTALIISWLDAALVAILPFFWRKKDSDVQCTYNPTTEWSIMVILTNVCVPFLVMMYCHMCTASFAIRYNRKKQKDKTTVHMLRCELFPEEVGQTIDEATFIKQKREFVKRQRRITCIFAVVLGAFVVCWAPSSFYYLIKTVCPQCFQPAFIEFEPVFKAAVKLLTFLNSSLNPWICLLLHHPFRKALCRTLFGIRRSEELSETYL